MAKLKYDRLEAEERIARYDTIINSLRDDRNIISETNSIISLRREANEHTMAAYKSLKAEASRHPETDYAERLKKIPVIHIGDRVYHPGEQYAILERAIQKREIEITKLATKGQYTEALKEEGNYLFELGYFVRSAREYDDLQIRIGRLYAERELLLDYLSGEKKQDKLRAREMEKISVRNMVTKLQLHYPEKTVDELLWHIADKVNKAFESIKAAYYYKEKTVS
jgi:hypothetical protein